ncbi:uncharacterized protein [Littorina saxatilis]|uniref:uncharacterized protein n=1 Tax=Littorina saxatilis TaxID=31220 RepID=UPI0038B49F1C
MGKKVDDSANSAIPECPEGRRICGTRNGTCAENIGQEVVTQSCEGSEPCGVTLTIKKVRQCDGGTYSCYVFSSGNVSNYDVASLTVSVKDCEDNTHGPECLDTCGRCAGNQTCNTTTGQCSACLAGWTPPLCKTAVPEEPLLTPEQKVVVGVLAGAPLSWAFIATLIQICQILGNAGWLPFVSLGGKKEEKGKDAEESSDEEEPPSKCSRFLNCMFCGGAGVCLLSFLFCISCGKLMSKKFTWQKEKVIQNDAESKEPESSLADHGRTEEMAQKEHPGEESEDSADIPIYPTESDKERTPSSEGLLNPDESLDQEEVIQQSYQKDIVDGEHTVTSQSHVPKTDRAKFTSQYFDTANWLTTPYGELSQSRSTSTSATNLRQFDSRHFPIDKSKSQREIKKQMSVIEIEEEKKNVI